MEDSSNFLNSLTLIFKLLLVFFDKYVFFCNSEWLRENRIRKNLFGLSLIVIFFLITFFF